MIYWKINAKPLFLNIYQELWIMYCINSNNVPAVRYLHFLGNEKITYSVCYRLFP